MIGNAIVVGGGIGGLATALALLKHGWDVQVLERAPEFGEVGAGISLWSNGVKALDALGIGDMVRQRATAETETGIRDAHGRWLSRLNMAEVEHRYGGVIMLHRADLLTVLREALPEHALHTGIEVTGATDSRLAAADLIVAADGRNSVIRRSLWPDAPPARYSGYTAWRLLVHPKTPLHAGSESWGRGERIGLAPMPDGRIYMYGTANRPAGERSPDGELAELRRRFHAWHDPIPELLATAEEESVLRHDIYDLPPLKSYVSGRTALIGDAAHAMTPDLGQGANQALEDAITLAACLAAQPIDQALMSYDLARRPRSQMIAARSRRIGQISQWNKGTGLRNALIRATPQSALLRSQHPVLTWNAPE
jgi:2-polyprenyl-6-methoxyphenol hydroxylase-like FAD-dependent oxidoreductase